MAIIETNRPDLAARARAGSIDLFMHPSYQWTRRKVLHVIADKDGNCVHAETSMDLLLQWLWDNEIRVVTVVLTNNTHLRLELERAVRAVQRLEQVAPFATITPTE